MVLEHRGRESDDVDGADLGKDGVPILLDQELAGQIRLPPDVETDDVSGYELRLRPRRDGGFPLPAQGSRDGESREE
jgi:hypothetical protein